MFESFLLFSALLLKYWSSSAEILDVIYGKYDDVGFFVAGGYFFHMAESHKHILHATESGICRIINK